MKKLYFVAGGESCGNHLATNLLVKAGIKRGTNIMDIIKPKEILNRDFPIVYRRSFPHGGQYYAINQLLKPIYDKEILKKEEVMVIVCMRNWVSASRSALMRHSKTIEEALFKLRKGYKHIFSSISYNDYDYTFFSFDEAMRSPEKYIKHFYDQIGLNMPENVINLITEENEKYYGQDWIQRWHSGKRRPTEDY